MADARPARGRQGPLDGEGRARVRRVRAPSTTTPTGACSARCSTGRRLRSRARTELPAGPPSDDAILVTCAYLVDAVEPLGAAVALPRGDRRGARPRRARARGVLVPLPGGRVGLRALPRAQDGVPAGLPGGLRLRGRARRRPRRPLAPRARRPGAGRRRAAREKVLRVVQGRVRLPEPVPAPPPL